MRCGKHYGLTRDKRQMCRLQAYKTLSMPTGRVPGVRGRARTITGGFVHRFSTSIAPTQFLQLIYMRMSLSLLICSTRSSRSCSTSGTSDHGRQRLRVQEGTWTIPRTWDTIKSYIKKQHATIDHTGHECVGSFGLTFILFYVILCPTHLFYAYHLISRRIILHVI